MKDEVPDFVRYGESLANRRVRSVEADDALIVLDDQDARRFADRCGLKVIGTLGILLAAKQRGVIASLRAEINALVALGFRVNPQLVTAVLQRARE